MKVLFDTNVILDHLLLRDGFHEVAAILVAKVESGIVSGFLGATTVTIVHYLAAKTIGHKKALIAIKMLLQLFEVAPVNRLVLTGALDSRITDFEDAVLHEAALHIGVEAIVTRDLRAFSQGTISAYSPPEMASLLLSL